MRSVIPLAAALAALALATPALAQDVVVQGTTDVRDAGLVDDVLTPGFHAAYPQYDLKYIAVGTGQALTNARAGQGDAVLTHAPPLEAQFVADGFSREGPGRAIFYSDYVIVGPKGDPAGVAAGARHDAAKAFELIAAAGAAGKASFVSRGDNSGTNVEEQQIWALTTSGVPLCDVATGRKQPSTTSGACPTSPTDPPWYKRANTGQAATVQLADQCSFAGAAAGGCYDITDRGTFNRLVANGSVKNLQIVSDDNDTSARGGQNLLVNSFHAYAVNPEKFAPGQINVAGARAFLDYLTSPALQDRLASYPNATNPAFFADATPQITIDSAKVTRLTAGKPVTISGSIGNKLPGTPVLANDTVDVQLAGSVFSLPRVVASGKSDASGRYSITFTPTRSGSYQVATRDITETVLPTTPPFADRLTAGSTPYGTVRVTAAVGLNRTRVRPGQVAVFGRVEPAGGRTGARVILLGRRGRGPFSTLAAKKLGARGANYSLTATKLRPGRIQLEVRYEDPLVVTPGTSKPTTVTIPGAKKR